MQLRSVNVGVERTSFVFARRNSRFWEVCIRNDVTAARYITQAMGRQKNIWTFSIDRHPVKVGANACITLRSGILNRVFPLSIIFYEYIMNEPCNILERKKNVWERKNRFYDTFLDHPWLDSGWKKVSFSVRVKSLERVAKISIIEAANVLARSTWN